ncbi:MAG: hypothetical protein ACKO5Q_18360 [Microcystaceae cyanobacterium]
MTITFGLVTEGRTDQAVIRAILTGYFGDDNIRVTSLNPDDQNKLGGWSQVFRYCHSEDFQEAFESKDYVIIHIDTDISPEYKIPQIDQDGNRLSPNQLIQNVKDKLKNLLDPEFYQRYGARIIFAIAVHSIECWLLPLYGRENEKSAIDGCFEKLDEAISQAPEKSPVKKLVKKSRCYEKIALPYANKETLLNYYFRNPSFKIFIEDLEARNIFT